MFDSKVTTGAGLAELHAAKLTFITLRARTAKLTAALEALPDSAWTQITLERRGPYARPEVHEQDVTVRGCPTPLRQIGVRGLGHDHPTLILTNNRDHPAKKIVGRYAKRMAIEQRLAESIRSFHLDALSSAVALNVDLDTTLTVWAAAAYDHLRQHLPGYPPSNPRHDLATLHQHQRPDHDHPRPHHLPPQKPHLQPRHAAHSSPTPTSHGGTDARYASSSPNPTPSRP